MMYTRLSLLITFLFLNLTSNFDVHAQVEFNFDNSSEIGSFSWLHDVENWPSMVKDISTIDGKLHFIPWTSGWYADYMAPFLFLKVQGDFVVESRVLVKGIESDEPKAEWSLGGIMIREPLNITSSGWHRGKQNWLFLTTGFADDLNQPVFETKTTVNSKSTLQLHPNELDWVTLKIERNRSVFTLWYKYDDQQEWIQIEEFIRADLPQELQVGLIAYTDFYSAERGLMRDVKRYNSTRVEYGSPDLTFVVDYFRLSQ